eukprot:248738-Pleurochrysis_carterae.AAC.1
MYASLEERLSQVTLFSEWRSRTHAIDELSISPIMHVEGSTLLMARCKKLAHMEELEGSA